MPTSDYILCIKKEKNEKSETISALVFRFNKFSLEDSLKAKKRAKNDDSIKHKSLQLFLRHKLADYH